MPTTSGLQALRAHYERFPYPHTPLFIGLDYARLALLNYQASVFACFGSTQFASKKPRILVAGCGTFEAIAVSKANPDAEIVAIDLSESSLRKLKWQIFFRARNSKIQLQQADLLDLPATLGNFDFILATGVLHHLPNPLLGLQALVKRLNPRGVMRLMLYSRHGREWIERLRDWRKALGLQTRKELEGALNLLPADHPFRLTYALYSDARNESGLRDGFFHVQEYSFDALEMPEFLANAGLELRKFLHKASGQEKNLDPWGKKLTPWERIAILDRWNALEENFLFLAARIEEKSLLPTGSYVLNPALQKFSRKKMESSILGEIVSLEIPAQENTQSKKLEDALFLLRTGTSQ